MSYIGTFCTPMGLVSMNSKRWRSFALRQHSLRASPRARVDAISMYPLLPSRLETVLGKTFQFSFVFDVAAFVQSTVDHEQYRF